MSLDLSLTRMTCEYLQDEDRIRIRGLVVGGEDQSETHTLWLTQRLALRLIPALVDVLEKSEQLHSAGLAKEQQAEVQGMKQDLVASQAAAAAEPAVELKENSPDWLISHIDLSPKEGQLQLILRNEQHRLCLMLGGAALRQWLNILLHAFRQGQWPLSVWPEWLLQKEQLASRQVVHH